MATQLASTTSSAATAALHDRQSQKYLVFHLAEEEYAIPVLQVREIMGLQDITLVPQLPSYVKGVINLRGRVIPVLDLRTRFGLAPVEYTSRTCIIVVQTGLESGTVLVGFIVDGVAEVTAVPAQNIEETPHFGPGIELPHIVGLAKEQDRVRILLSIPQILAYSGDLWTLQAQVAAVQ